MKNLSFDNGFESFTINGDANRIIRFNPADPEIVNRLLKAQEFFASYEVPEGLELNADGSMKSDLEQAGAYVTESTKTMRNAFNEIFNADVFDTIFNGQSPLCIVGNKYLFESVFDGLLEILKPALEKYNKSNSSKLEKYLEDTN